MAFGADFDNDICSMLTEIHSHSVSEVFTACTHSDYIVRIIGPQYTNMSRHNTF